MEIQKENGIISNQYWCSALIPYYPDSTEIFRLCTRKAKEIIDGYGFCKQHAKIYRREKSKESFIENSTKKGE